MNMDNLTAIFNNYIIPNENYCCDEIAEDFLQQCNNEGHLLFIYNKNLFKNVVVPSDITSEFKQDYVYHCIFIIDEYVLDKQNLNTLVTLEEYILTLLQLNNGEILISNKLDQRRF